ncbi:MAG: uncharacterized protein QOK20_1208 [Acidimicrobiaceae bacterium]|jgi:catechol 2,3-dioxygenase-like lactoylglutathione lyase family enzyme|nr:uncharacterized protein [Acidimicrobiaceae bacterium]
MQPRVDIITLGVPDLDIARRFYLDGLGWPAVFDVPGEVAFIQIGHGLLLGLFGSAALDVDAGDPPREGPHTGAPPMSLAHIVATEDEVGELLRQAEAAGGTILKPPQRADFGGFHGYFADPAGFRWEVATNSGWHVDADGTVTLGPVVD